MRRVVYSLALVALAGGCSLPAAYSGIVPKVVAAPFLTYVDGDEEAGTTTFFSAPLLSYRSTRTAPGRFESNTCVAPFLFNRQSTTREIRVVREEPGAHCPDQDPLAPPLPTNTKKAKKKKKKQGVTLSRPRSDYELPVRRPTRRKDSGAPSGERKRKKKRKKKKKKKVLEYELPGVAGNRRWEGATLTLPAGAEIAKHRYPAEAGALNLLWPLIRVAREIPGRVIVRSRTGSSVYEVGPESTEIRVLPIFSHTRNRKISQTILWPLLGFGWETTAKGTYIRLFYFLRFKVD